MAQLAGATPGSARTFWLTWSEAPAPGISTRLRRSSESPERPLLTSLLSTWLLGLFDVRGSVMSLHSLGDYDRRHTGLLQLMRPYDVFTYDRWRHEALRGIVGRVPEDLRVGYAILGAYAEFRGDSLGERGPDWPIPAYHPLLYLWSCLHLQGRRGMSHFSPLITTAYEELLHDRVLLEIL